MRESDEPLTDTLVRCLADPTDLKALERLENDGDQAGARLMRARLADQAALRLDAALEDNRARVRRQLGRDWAWATDEVMSDLTIRTIRRLDYWHRTNTDRAEGGATSLAAFVNQLTGTVVGEWFKTQRPKHRTGMTQTPERRAGRLKPPTDPDDRTAWERWRRHEQTLADSDVICDASDIFEGRDGDGESPGSPAAGDRESYRQWDGDTADAPLPVSAGYKTDMEALALAVQAEWGLAAWKRILTRCMTSNRARPLLREIRHWLEAHHNGTTPRLDRYPYLRACAGTGARNRPKTGDGRVKEQTKGQREAGRRGPRTIEERKERGRTRTRHPADPRDPPDMGAGVDHARRDVRRMEDALRRDRRRPRRRLAMDPGDPRPARARPVHQGRGRRGHGVLGGDARDMARQMA